MKFFIKLWSFIFLWVCLSPSNACHKTTPTNPDLPSATQEGKGTVGCYINGKSWVPKPYLCVACSNYLSVENMSFQDSMTFNANKSSQHMDFEFKKARLGENKMLNMFIYSDINAEKYYYLDKKQPYKVTLTKIDSVKGIISGTFEFTAIERNNRDTIVVTLGRFDSGNLTSQFW